MTWLALDTATSTASVALGRGASDAVEERLVGARQHAGALIPMVDRLLAQRGQTLGDIAGLLLSDGPGSFTGLRVGAAFAKGLWDTRGVALRTAPSLLVRAMAVAEAGGVVLAATDALRGDVYAAVYRFGAGPIEVRMPPGVFRAEEFAALAEAADRIVGDLTPDQQRLAGVRYAGAVPPSARDLLELRHHEGATTLIADVHTWEPVYGRPAEAQAKWEREHGRALPHSAGAPG